MAKFDCVPPSLGRYKIPRPILAATVDSLRITGQGRKEAVALWQGRVVSDTLAEVTKLIVPTQITGARHFNIPLDERLRIMDDLNRVGEFILIQLHTHPREAFHSQADDQYAVTKHLHALSIVIPNFGMQWTGRFSETSVNVNFGGGVWRELPPADVDRLLEIV
jgi:hypothetical protein